MSDDPAVHSELEWVVARFPEEAALARWMFLTDPVFRNACEDYRLAREGLAEFEKRAAGAPRTEVGEYRVLVRELEAELQAMLGAASGVAWSPSRPKPRGRAP